jgi:ferredoxin-NADP reductase
VAGRRFGILRDLARYVPFAARRLALAAGRGASGNEGGGAALADLLRAVHPERMRLRVVEVIRETPSTSTFRTERADGEIPPFHAGQHVAVHVAIDGVRTSRPYSISSPPGAGHLDLTIKAAPGGFVAPYLLSRLAVGEVLETSGPAGALRYEPLIDGRDLVFVAGGSGITPFASMVRELARLPDPPAVHLLYGNRSPDDVIFRTDLADIEASGRWLRVSHVCSEPPAGFTGPTGFVDEAFLRDRVGDVRGKRFFVCGPAGLHDVVLDALAALGVSRHAVRREVFGFGGRVTEAPGWPAGVAADARFVVEVEGAEPFAAAAAEPLLASLERHGLALPAVCRAGECSGCRVRLVRGEVFVPGTVRLREADAAGGWIHSCAAYPISDLRLRL